MPEFDLFISYHRADEAVVEPLARKLRAAGLAVYLDRWFAVPGMPWMSALETTLAQCRAVAVCIGSWHRDLSVSYISLANVDAAAFRSAEALALFGRSLEISNRLAQLEPANAVWKNDLDCVRQRMAELKTRAPTR